MSWMSRAERIYAQLPIAAQNVLFSAYGLQALRSRRGRFFCEKLAELLVSQHWSQDQIEHHQGEQLRTLVRRCYERVPYYRRVWRRLGVVPSDIRERADLQKLPVLTKEEVREHAAELIADDAERRNLVPVHTSGTTGKSLQFYWAAHQAQFVWAVWWRHRLWSGVGLDDWHANFTGRLMVPAEQARPPYWRWCLPLRQWAFNMQNVTPEKVGSIVQFLNSHRAVYYSGYPSIIHTLSALALEQGLSLQQRPRYIFTGAENLFAHQRAAIERFTGAKLVDQYGFSEACGNASSCPEGVYHEDFELGILECVEPAVLGEQERTASNQSGDALPPGAVAGKIVCTGFANPWYPFVRYEVGDSGVWAPPDYRCACGRQSRVLLRIDGRQDDSVLTPEGRHIMRFDYLFKDTQHVREVQVVQERLGELRLKVVRRADYSARDEAQIRADVRRWISPRMVVQFDYVEAIEREANGKFRAVRSLLPVK